MDINRHMLLSANAKLELEWWVSNVMTAKISCLVVSPRASSRQMLLTKVGGLCSEHRKSVITLTIQNC